MITVREMAAALNVSKQSVRRYLKKYGIKPIETDSNTQTQYYNDKDLDYLRCLLHQPQQPQQNDTDHELQYIQHLEDEIDRLNSHIEALIASNAALTTRIFQLEDKSSTKKRSGLWRQLIQKLR